MSSGNHGLPLIGRQQYSEEDVAKALRKQLCINASTAALSQLVRANAEQLRATDGKKGLLDPIDTALLARDYGVWFARAMKDITDEDLNVDFEEAVKELDTSNEEKDEDKEEDGLT